MKKRPIPVTILAVLAGIAGVLAVIHFFQALGIFPLLLGPFKVNANLLTPNWWYALMWGLMAYIWFWLVQMLWRMDPSAWLFLAVISTFELILATMTLLFGGVTTTFSDVSTSFIVSGLILIYVLLPSTKAAFGIPSQQKS